VHDVLRSPGQSLDAAIRAFFEPRFGHDFSQVRVHTDARAEESARAVNALAYTVGRDVVFGKGQYAHGRMAGCQLLAHELTHVVQQAKQTSLQNKLEIGPADDSLEREADNTAVRVLNSQHPVPSFLPGRQGQQSHGGIIQRAAIYRGDILDEGSCKHLACNSMYACEDNTNGVTCQKGTRNASETKKFRPLFTCDTRCENNLTCSDSDTWMAIPKTRFKRPKCNQDLVICANGKFTHGQVRDRSEIEAWEVGRGIQDNMGVSPYATFSGAIYGDESDPDFKEDTRCHSASSQKSERSTIPSSPPGKVEGEEMPAIPASPPDAHVPVLRRTTAPVMQRASLPPSSSATPVSPAEAKKVCLTFDDGPENGTEDVLDALGGTVPAAFFLTGKHMASDLTMQTRLVERMLKEGHQIGNHTFTHKPQTTKGYEMTYGDLSDPANLKKFQDNYNTNEQHFRTLLGATSPVFQLARLPGDGRFVKAGENLIFVIATEGMGMAHVTWNFEFAPNGEFSWVPINDWKTVTGVAASEDRYPRASEIILFHDRHWSGGNKTLLETALKKLKANNFTFGRLDKVGKCT
jgi:peptidoglycan/xylan/chitin deacetylase (PgdA/CDA1 family)